MRLKVSSSQSLRQDSSTGRPVGMGVAREVNSTRDQLLHNQLSADQLFTRSTSLSQLL